MKLIISAVRYITLSGCIMLCTSVQYEQVRAELESDPLGRNLNECPRNKDELRSYPFPPFEGQIDIGLYPNRGEAISGAERAIDANNSAAQDAKQERKNQYKEVKQNMEKSFKKQKTCSGQGELIVFTSLEESPLRAGASRAGRGYRSLVIAPGRAYALCCVPSRNRLMEDY